MTEIPIVNQLHGMTPATLRADYHYGAYVCQEAATLITLLVETLEEAEQFMRTGFGEHTVFGSVCGALVIARRES